MAGEGEGEGEGEVGDFEWPVRVYYEDTDSGGVVYYANYLKFMERARTEWLRALGFEQDRLVAEQGVLFVVRSANLEYYLPARFNDLLRVVCRVAEQRRASLVFRQDVFRDAQSRDLLCAGRIKVVCVDARTFKPRPFPRSVLSEIVGDG